MKIANEFIRLPYLFDVEQLKKEVVAFDKSEWLPHIQAYVGNSSIPLISLNGVMNDDFNGPMKVTEKLNRSLYIKQVIASFGEVFGRSRLMGLDGKCSVPEHRDVQYHWQNRVRIHIPIITNPDVVFYCGDSHVHMAAGEAWIFDSWKRHSVENNSNQFRVHLVIDTSGSVKFWNTVALSEWRSDLGVRKPAAVMDRFLPYEQDKESEIITENYNAPLVMNPGEVDAIIAEILADMRACQGNSAQAANFFEKSMFEFRLEWRRIWLLYGPSREGWVHYQALLDRVQLPRAGLTLASNGASPVHAFGAKILASALCISLADQYATGLQEP